MNTCRICGRPLEAAKRGRPRIFCSDKCRQTAHRATPEYPFAMMLADRWCRWERVVRGDGATKRPITPDGRPASSTDRSTWSAYGDARDGAGDGMGFMLGDGVACIDLDHCYDRRNRLEWWAKMLIAPVAGRAYIEISPSGDGLHVWGLLEPRPGMRIRNDMGMNIEFYSRDRFMTVTGRRHADSGRELPDLTNLWGVCSRLR